MATSWLVNFEFKPPSQKTQPVILLLSLLFALALCCSIIILSSRLLPPMGAVATLLDLLGRRERDAGLLSLCFLFLMLHAACHNNTSTSLTKARQQKTAIFHEMPSKPKPIKCA
jgi:hypothetical protein